MSPAKCVSSLRPSDFASAPVWRHKRAEDLLPHEDESYVESVAKTPVRDAYDHYFVANVRLKDGSEEVVLIGSTEASQPALNAVSQFFVFYRTDSLHRWTGSPLAYDPIERDPTLLAQFLGKSPDDVFPFRYDISALLDGHPDVVTRQVMPTSSSEAAPSSPFEAAVRAALRTTSLGEVGDDA